jgi:hypothetical protein
MVGRITAICKVETTVASVDMHGCNRSITSDEVTKAYSMEYRRWR